MEWSVLKASLLSRGTVRLAGVPAGDFISRSSAGPGAGGEGSVFFSVGARRVRLVPVPEAEAVITHLGDGRATLSLGGEEVDGVLEHPGLHCPRQAYITVTGSCTFRCRYCPVPALHGARKTPEEVEALIRRVSGRVDAISITSGVRESIGEEDAYVCGVVSRLGGFGLPIGVSIYPLPDTPDRLARLGVDEVKWNLEAATPTLFSRMCPGLDYDLVLRVLRQSVRLFGPGRVFSNVLVGLGETDRELAACVRALVSEGVIPVLRPLTPAGDLAGFQRPPAARLLKVAAMHKEALREAGLDTRSAKTMCTACTGCDLVPGKDL